MAAKHTIRGPYNRRCDANAFNNKTDGNGGHGTGRCGRQLPPDNPAHGRKTGTPTIDRARGQG